MTDVLVQSDVFHRVDGVRTTCGYGSRAMRLGFGALLLADDDPTLAWRRPCRLCWPDVSTEPPGWWASGLGSGAGMTTEHPHRPDLPPDQPGSPQPVEPQPMQPAEPEREEPEASDQPTQR